MAQRPKLSREIDPVDGKKKDFVDIELDTIVVAMLANGVACSFRYEGKVFRLRHVKDPNYNFSAQATLTPKAAAAAKDLQLLMLLARLRGDDDPEIPQLNEFAASVWTEAGRRGFIDDNGASELEHIKFVATPAGLAFLKAAEDSQ